MNPRLKKFLSFYRPYKRLFVCVLSATLLSALIALVFPLCIRYITKNVLEEGMPSATNQIYLVGGVMIALLLVQTAASSYFDYKGHVMGAMMERDIRRELFTHYQKLSFSFYDNHSVGQLMSRITTDLLMLTELYHHGPEDLVVYLVKFIGAFVILLAINAKLALIVFAFLPIMAIFILYFSKRMGIAWKTSWERIGDVNTQVEESLSGIRVVKSFANEEMEAKKFAFENNRSLVAGQKYTARKPFYTRAWLRSPSLSPFPSSFSAGSPSRNRPLRWQILSLSFCMSVTSPNPYRS